ncbi:MAG: DUF4349 domain-containing protein [Flavobacteriales bacterium]
MKKIIFPLAIVSLSLFSCSGGYDAESAYNAKAYSEDAIAADSTLSSSAAIENVHSNRRFVRTADIKFRTNDVRSATFAIEDVVAKNSGFVTHTNLFSSVNYVETVPVSEDSTMETTHYTMENSIEIRVPNTQMDDVLKDINGLVDFLDYRNINADDVTLKLLANKLVQKRITTHEKRMDNVIHNGGTLKSTTAAENSLLEKEEKKDDAIVANLSIQDQVDFSTVKIYLYQRSSVKQQLLAREKIVEPYEPSFFSKVGDSLAFGLNGLEILVLGLLKIWWVLLLVGVGGGLLYKTLRKK